jgi:hypothetical protein
MRKEIGLILQMKKEIKVKTSSDFVTLVKRLLMQLERPSLCRVI